MTPSAGAMMEVSLLRWRASRTTASLAVTAAAARAERASALATAASNCSSSCSLRRPRPCASTRSASRRSRLRRISASKAATSADTRPAWARASSARAARGSSRASTWPRRTSSPTRTGRSMTRPPAEGAATVSCTGASAPSAFTSPVTAPRVTGATSTTGGGPGNGRQWASMLAPMAASVSAARMATSQRADRAVSAGSDGGAGARGTAIACLYWPCQRVQQGPFPSVRVPSSGRRSRRPRKSCAGGITRRESCASALVPGARLTGSPGREAEQVDEI